MALSPEVSLLHTNAQLSKLKESPTSTDALQLMRMLSNNPWLFSVGIPRSGDLRSVGDLELEKLRKVLQIEYGQAGILGTPQLMTNDVLGQPNFIASSLRFSAGTLYLRERSGLWTSRGGIYEDTDVPVKSIMYITEPPRE